FRMTVKHLFVEHSKVNERGTFSPGDTLSGQVIVVTTKETKVQCFFVRAKGKAKVTWCEKDGQSTVVHTDKKKYFYFEHIILQDKNKGDEMCFHSPFRFQINMPSSYKGKWGSVTYSLRAQLTQSIWLIHKTKTEFPFLTKSEFPFMPQQGMTDKKMKLFASGTVNMDVRIDRTGFHQGEGIKVVASIQNKSSRDVTPKFCLYRKHSYFADKTRKVVTKTLLKEVGEAIPPSACQTVTRIITIPPDTDPSVLNCNILRAEHRLKVYLDIKYASDPEVKFPIVILPALENTDKDKETAYFPFGSAFTDASGETNSAQNPPPYSTYGMYPTVSDFGGKS
uniref:Arrestin C-terminal-like domain-containing protein n=1 Tax=Sphaeramia orbicularis TaxID=375764 RepID=A0A673CDS6_9TELE